MQLWRTNKAIYYVNSFIIKGGRSRSKFYLVSSILQSLQVFEFHFVDLDILCLVFVQFFDHFQRLCVPDPSITQQHKHQIKIWMFLINNALCPSKQATQHIIIITILVSGKLRFGKNFNFWVLRGRNVQMYVILLWMCWEFQGFRNSGAFGGLKTSANLQFSGSRRNQAKKKEYTNKQTNRVAEKISSNFFLRTDASANGQLASSWCTKITFSRIALETPMSAGTSLSMSAHL